MKYVVLLLSLLGFSCGSCQPPPVVIQPNDTDRCGAACAHLVALGCEEGQPLPDGTSCEEFCVDSQVNGHALAPSCVEKVKACADLKTCLAPRVFEDRLP